jgi:hypothetical protein
MTKTKTNDYLPEGYTPPQSEFIKLAEGDNEFRIASFPLIGHLYWEDEDGNIVQKGQIQKGNKPIRIEYNKPLPKGVEFTDVKEFWMFKVWDHEANRVRILEITQQTIIKALAEYIESPKWGDPREYDVNIKKEGAGKETKYYVMPSPPTPLPAEAKQAIKDNKTVLEEFLTDLKGKGQVATASPKAQEQVEVDEDDLPF